MRLISVEIQVVLDKGLLDSQHLEQVVRRKAGCLFECALQLSRRHVGNDCHVSDRIDVIQTCEQFRSQSVNGYKIRKDELMNQFGQNGRLVSEAQFCECVCRLGKWQRAGIRRLHHTGHHLIEVALPNAWQETNADEMEVLAEIQHFSRSAESRDSRSLGVCEIEYDVHAGIWQNMEMKVVSQRGVRFDFPKPMHDFRDVAGRLHLGVLN